MFSTGDIVYAKSGKYEYYTVLAHSKDMGANFYKLITPNGMITGRFHQDELVLAYPDAEIDSTYVSLTRELCLSFLSQGHHKPTIEAQLLEDEEDRINFERGFAHALYSHLNQRSYV